MRPGESVEFQLALVIEAEVAGALGQLFDDGGGEDLAAVGAVGDARGRAGETGVWPWVLLPNPPTRRLGRLTNYDL